MYTLDYLNCFIENLDLPEASRASLREKTPQEDHGSGR